MAVKVPEISARVYAQINGLSRGKINDMCGDKELPCRKIGPPPKKGVRDGRIWWVNLDAVKTQADAKLLEGGSGNE